MHVSYLNLFIELEGALQASRTLPLELPAGIFPRFGSKSSQPADSFKSQNPRLMLDYKILFFCIKLLPVLIFSLPF